MSAKRNISSTMRSIYGTGNFNPRRFDRRPKKSAKRLYMWGIALFLFAIAAVIFVGMYIFGANSDSFTGERVDMNITGPSSPKIAQDQEYTLEITNSEDVALERVELFINWIASAKATANSGSSIEFVSSKVEPRTDDNNTWELGEIGVRETKTFGFSVRLNGDEGDLLELPYSITFQPRGFSSEFVVNSSKEFVLGEPLIDLEITGPDTASTDSEITLQVEIGGTRDMEIDDLLLYFEYADDFSVISFSPDLEEDAEVWNVSDLEDNKKYILQITGKITGELGDDARFVSYLKKENTSGTLIATEKNISIQSADISVLISASPAQGKKLQWGEQLNYTVIIENLGSYVARDVVVSVRLIGEELWSAGSISISDEGFFESGNIIWDAETTSALDSIRPEGDIELSFGLKTLDNPPKRFSGKPELVAVASIQSKFGDQDISVESNEMSINILAEMDFDVTGWYKSPEGVTWGTGPNPPLSGQETTYAIIWTLGPTTSALKDLVYSAKLPSNVIYKHDTNYSVGEISYDVESRIVTWRASKVPQLDLPIEIRFMLGITPQSQTTNNTKLLEQTDIVVVDDAADEKLEFFGNAVTIGSTQ